VLVSFSETVACIPAPYRSKAVVTGNPVRKRLYQADPVRGRLFVGCDESLPLILVVGGSLGSSFINALVSTVRARLLPRFFIVHQMGAREYVPHQETNYFAAPFFEEELPDIMAAADLVIGRAGANTLAELAALGKPSLLIPLPETGSRGDQLRNADFFQRSGASVVLAERDATEESFVSTVCALLGDRTRLAQMGHMASTLGAGKPAEVIAALIRERLG
jgi:UDP-N-acetylglucosamine--N-acetylmuramyl-(pentapeptide) pyrophosphoryl-undecaprenol N-acetylglucosamine transferase